MAQQPWSHAHSVATLSIPSATFASILRGCSPPKPDYLPRSLHRYHPSQSVNQPQITQYHHPNQFNRLPTLLLRVHKTHQPPSLTTVEIATQRSTSSPTETSIPQKFPKSSVQQEIPPLYSPRKKSYSRTLRAVSPTTSSKPQYGPCSRERTRSPT